MSELEKAPQSQAVELVGVFSRFLGRAVQLGARNWEIASGHSRKVLAAGDQ